MPMRACPAEVHADEITNRTIRGASPRDSCGFGCGSRQRAERSAGQARGISESANSERPSEDVPRLRVELTTRDPSLDEPERRAHFEAVLLPHLPAAYNLARWLTHHDHDAEDVVQEAYLRAFRFFDGFHGDGARAWFLTIVRNTCLTWLKRNRPAAPTTPFDERAHGPADDGPGPDGGLIQAANREIVQRALSELPVEFREAVGLR